MSGAAARTGKVQEKKSKEHIKQKHLEQGKNNYSNLTEENRMNGIIVNGRYNKNKKILGVLNLKGKRYIYINYKVYIQKVHYPIREAINYKKIYHGGEQIEDMSGAAARTGR